ncbi:hypothetical protein FRC19_009366 [Serendipita sp. 401]|nr:hypothetical protein FRC19_009366 [Serendipita sp. 401]
MESIQQLISLVIKADQFHDVPVESYIEKLGSLHPRLEKLHLPLARYDTKTIREIARCLPDLRDIGFKSGAYGPRYQEGRSVLDHLASFRMLPMLESITFPDILNLGLDYDLPSFVKRVRLEIDIFGDSDLEDAIIARKEEAIGRLLEGIDKEIMTKGGPRLKIIVIGDIIYEIDANRRFRRS